MTPGNPFAQLMGLTPSRLPKATSTTVVVQGKPVRDVRQIDRALQTVDPVSGELDALAIADAMRLRVEVERAKARAKYQASRADPVKMAKRKAWYEANKDKVREYKRAYDERTKAQQRKLKADWARRKANSNLEHRELMRKRSRDWYERNREAVLAKKKAQRVAAKAAKLAAKLAAAAGGVNK